MTLLIAGHDTTVGALAWALHQLELPLVFADDGSAVQASPEPERRVNVLFAMTRDGQCYQAPTPVTAAA